MNEIMMFNLTNRQTNFREHVYSREDKLRYDAVTKTRVYSTGGQLTAANYNDDRDEIIAGVNSIVNAQISASADISPTKISGTAATLTGTQTLTNKTLTSPVINVGSDAHGDIYFRNSSGVFSRLAPGTSGYFLKSQGSAADPVWASATSAAVGARVTRSTAQTITSGSETAIQFTSEDFDTDGFHDNSSNNTRITIPANLGGKYIIVANSNFASNPTNRRTLILKKNGSSFAQTEWGNANNNTPYMNLTAIDVLLAGDYVETFVFQNSGSDVNVDTYLSMSVLRIGS